MAVLKKTMIKTYEARNQMALKLMHGKIKEAITRLEKDGYGARPIIFQNKNVVVFAVAERTMAAALDHDNEGRKCGDDLKESTAAPADGGTSGQGLFQMAG